GGAQLIELRRSRVRAEHRKRGVSRDQSHDDEDHRHRTPQHEDGEAEAAEQEGGHGATPGWSPGEAQSTAKGPSWAVLSSLTLTFMSFIALHVRMRRSSGSRQNTARPEKAMRNSHAGQKRTSGSPASSPA